MSMQVEYRLKLGQDEFVLKAEVNDEKEFFEKMSFYSNLPKVGPNGELDVKLMFRTTKEGYKYYSILSEKAGMEYKFGQVNEKNGGLYPKGWEPAYGGSNDNSGAPASSPFPTAMPQPQTNIAPPTFAPPAFVAPAPQVNMAPPVQQYAPPVQQPAAPPVQTQAPNQQAVATVANDVLSRFGIKK